MSDEITGRIGFARPPELRGAEIIRADGCFGHVRMLHENHLVTIGQAGSVDWRHRGQGYTSMPGELDLMEPGEIHELGKFRSATVDQRLLFLPPRLIADAAGELEVGPCRLGLRCGHRRDPELFGAVDRFHRAMEDGGTLLERESRFWTCVRMHVERSLAVRPLVPEPLDLAGAVERIEADFARELSLDELSAAAGVGKFRLIRAFKARFGVPPHAYLIETRLRRARDLLRAGRAPAGVAVEVGFADQSHFTRHFRRWVGVTPALFRRG